MAADTHGYTDFAFGQAKKLHIDLCPHLKSMRDRKIHLQNEMAPFEGLESICNNTIVMGNIRAHWDQLVRIAASIESGQVSANIALAKFGSAALGDPIYNAGVHFGRLCRSLFLCDYYLNDDFRHAIKNILSQGEAVHVLQREIHTGAHSNPRQEQEHMVALSLSLSLSLSLVTNMVMAWNTSRIQALLDENGMGTPEWMRIMKPARSAHVNFRGTMKFSVRAYASRLIAGGARSAVA